MSFKFSVVRRLCFASSIDILPPPGVKRDYANNSLVPVRLPQIQKAIEERRLVSRANFEYQT